MIEKLTYIARNGMETEVNLGAGVNPFGKANGPEVNSHGTIGVKWRASGVERHILVMPKDGREKGRTISAYPTKDMNYLIVVYFSDKAVEAPNNAEVFDEYGDRVVRLMSPDSERYSQFTQPTWSGTGDDAMTICLEVKSEQYDGYQWIEERELLVPDFEFTDKIISKSRR